MMNPERETIPFDVLFVGAGPASLAGALRLKQLADANGRELEIAVIEKGSEVGAHAVSGAILDPCALKELLPDFLDRGFPFEAVVRGDALYYLTSDKAVCAPVLPRYLHNAGNYVISLSRFTRWLGALAEEAGINVFCGFSGKEVLYDEAGGRVIGVRTGDKGLDKEGRPKANFEPGADLTAEVTVFGEGARGSLFKELAVRMKLEADRMPQVYETGIKEVIELPEPGVFAASGPNVMHFLGYPLGPFRAGGGFLYEMGEKRIGIGYLTALGYAEPWMDPYEMLLRFKSHPFIRERIASGKVIEQGARTVSVGGFYTIPKLVLNGGLVIGASAGIHDVLGLKGIHAAMYSGMWAAEAAFAALQSGDTSEGGLSTYPKAFENSRLRSDIFVGRNTTAALAKRNPVRYLFLGAQYVSAGKGLRDPMWLHADATTLEPVSRLPKPSEEPPVSPDGVSLVDKLTGVYLSKTHHREDQPCHLIVHDRKLCETICTERYGNPCTRFCPAQVYEMHEHPETGRRELRLNPSNCLHCKTCDIKDPFGNITWTCPEGGEGPEYRLV